MQWASANCLLSIAYWIKKIQPLAGFFIMLFV
jgi:hypothetical protein